AAVLPQAGPEVAHHPYVVEPIGGEIPPRRAEQNTRKKDGTGPEQESGDPPDGTCGPIPDATLRHARPALSAVSVLNSGLQSVLPHAARPAEGTAPKPQGRVRRPARTHVR